MYNITPATQINHEYHKEDTQISEKVWGNEFLSNVKVTCFIACHLKTEHCLTNFIDLHGKIPTSTTGPAVNS